MIESLLLTLLIGVVSLLLFYGFAYWQRQRIAPQARNTLPTLLYFCSDYCAACPDQTNYLAELRERWNGRFRLQRINADQTPQKVNACGIFTLPTTILIDPHGAVKHINYGVTDAQKLQQQLETITN